MTSGDSLEDRLGKLSTTPQDDLTVIAKQAADLVPGRYRVLVMVTDPDSPYAGVALKGYDGADGKEVVRLAVEDALVHIQALIHSVDPDWRSMFDIGPLN